MAGADKAIVEFLPGRGPDRNPVNVVLPLILGALCAAILAVGFLYARSQQKDMEAAVASHLSSIADLKVQQILAWRSERLADAVGISANPLVSASLSAQSQFGLQGWMESIRKLYGYSDVAILDDKGQALNVATEDARSDDPSVPSLITAALQTGKPKASDLEAGPFGTINQDFVAPVLSAEGTPIGRVVLLRVESSAFLNSLIQSWPTPSPTGECLLVRREGDRVRYLNEPRHRKLAPLEMTLPLASNLPAAMAAQGREGIEQSRDYRGVKVVAALRQIPGTPWALVTKVDAAEIYSPLHQRFLAIGVVVGLLLAACLGTFGVFWNLQRSRFFQREHEAALAREALAGRYAHLSRFVNDIVLLLDPEGKILEANDYASATYGYSTNELVGMSIRDLLDPSEVPGCAERLQEVKNGLALFESKHRRKDGSAIEVEVSCRVVESDGRKFHQSVIRNISERKRAEEALRRVTRAMRVLSASNQALVRSTDEATLFRAICGAVTATGGYPLAWIAFAEEDEKCSIRIAAAAGREVSYLDQHAVSWADRPEGRGPTGTTIRTGQITVFNDLQSSPYFQPWEERAHRHGFRAAVALPLNCDEEVIGALTIYTSEPDAFRQEEVDLLKELAGDLSYGISGHRQRLAQARTEEALMQSALEFRALFDTANDSIFIIDVDGHFLEVNQVACDRLGYSRNELLEMTVNDIDAPAFVSQQPARKAKLIQSGEDLLETVHIRKDGVELPVEISSRMFEYRGALAVLCVARDITERKQSEAVGRKHAVELERAKTAAENASQAKSQFLANMSHEIRTPMNGIIGTSGLILDTPLTPEQRDYAETIRNSAGALLAIVNDVLDFSKIEAGRMKIECVNFDLVARLEEIGELLAPQARAKNLEYVFEAQVERRWVTGDAGRIRQIVLNLLGNAIKFTDQGQVTLQVCEAVSTPGQAMFAISVADTGIGIPALDLPLLFDAFAQGDSSMTKKQQGTGLGLAISQRLAELMNATLTVTSELGKGATFVLTIPLPIATVAPTPRQPDQSLSDKVSKRCRRILLVEDNMVNQKIGVRLLEKCSCRVDVAANGREAVEMAVRFPYDLIFMDCGMPEMDGFEATRTIRSRQQNGIRIPIVALTAHAIDGTREECLVSGMDDYVPKPVTIEAIQQALVRWSP